MDVEVLEDVDSGEWAIFVAGVERARFSELEATALRRRIMADARRNSRRKAEDAASE